MRASVTTTCNCIRTASCGFLSQQSCLVFISFGLKCAQARLYSFTFWKEDKLHTALSLSNALPEGMNNEAHAASRRWFRPAIADTFRSLLQGSVDYNRTLFLSVYKRDLRKHLQFVDIGDLFV